MAHSEQTPVQQQQNELPTDIRDTSLAVFHALQAVEHAANPQDIRVPLLALARSAIESDDQSTATTLVRVTGKIVIGKLRAKYPRSVNALLEYIGKEILTDGRFSKRDKTIPGPLYLKGIQSLRREPTKTLDYVRKISNRAHRPQPESFLLLKRSFDHATETGYKKRQKDAARQAGLYALGLLEKPQKVTPSEQIQIQTISDHLADQANTALVAGSLQGAFQLGLALLPYDPDRTKAIFHRVFASPAIDPILHEETKKILLRIDPDIHLTAARNALVSLDFETVDRSLRGAQRIDPNSEQVQSLSHTLMCVRAVRRAFNQALRGDGQNPPDPTEAKQNLKKLRELLGPGAQLAKLDEELRLAQQLLPSKGTVFVASPT